MNTDLSKDYIETEVFEVLKQMTPLKAPRPEGMSPIFFQRFSHIVGKPVSTTVLKALNTGEFPTFLNHTLITLIPKKQSPFKVAEFQPISLCNVIYKLISKAIANRLKNVLPYLISGSHSVFVPRCRITDNGLVA